MYDPETYQFQNDAIPPEAMREHLRAHDERMKDLQPLMSLIKATYETRFWDWISKREPSTKHNLGSRERVEVNKLQAAIADYLSALYPKRIDANFARSARTTGDPQKAALVTNDWINSLTMRTRLHLGAAQGLLYRGAGAKVGFDPGDEDPVDRTWCRVFPYWELVVDDAVHDEEDARYIGHVSYKPVSEVNEKYKLQLRGSPRADFLNGSSETANIGQKTVGHVRGEATSDNAAFVRVFEVCNLIDDYVDAETGARSKGRLEIYILGEAATDNIGVKPVYLGPLPMLSPSGKGIPHIAPLIFTREADHPNRGISYAERLLPQIIELNAFRSHAAIAARRDTRAYLYRRGMITQTELTALSEGRDGVMVGVDKKYTGQLSDVLVPLRHAPISANIMGMMNVAERDLDALRTTPSDTLGYNKNVTAEAVRASVGHTESEMGRHAEELDKWMTQIVRLFLCALVAAMHDIGDDSEGEDLTPESVGDDVEALAEMSEEEQEDALVVESATAALDEVVRLMAEEKDGEGEEREPPEQASDEDDEDDTATIQGREVTSADLFGEAERDADGATDEEDAIIETFELTAEISTGEDDIAAMASTETTIVLLDKSSEQEIHITAADLSSEFVIGFSETGRSPLANAELKENIVKLAPQIEKYFMALVKGGAEAALAYVMLKTLQEKFNLPPAYHPDAMLASVKEFTDKQEKEPTGATPAPDEAPAGAAPAPDPTAQLEQFRQLATTDPDAVIDQLATILPPEQHGILQQIKALPDLGQKAEQVLDLLNKLQPA